MKKDVFEYTEKELDALYGIMRLTSGEDTRGKQELQKRRFRELILPLGRHGNEWQKAWAYSKMVEEGKDFIRYFIEKYYSTYKPVYGADMEQEGLLWLCQNGMKYEPDKGTFSTYLTLNLKGVMHKFVNEQTNHVSTHYGDRMNNVKKAQAQFEQESREYTLEDLAVRTGYSVTVIKHTLALIQCNNVMLFDGNDSGVLNTMPSSIPSPEDKALQRELLEALRKALEKLPKDSKEVLAIRFFPEYYFEGELAVNRVPGFDCIAKYLGTTTSKVRTSYKRALMQLRKDPGLLAISDSFRKKNDNAIRDFRVICLNDKESFPDDPYED